MAVDKELVSILACPRCKGEVRLNEREDGIICPECNLCFPIEDGIPVMLVSEAKSLENTKKPQA